MLGAMKHALSGSGGFRIVERLNLFGEWVPVPGWVNQIHEEDIEWFERLWMDEDEFDARLRFAGVASE